MARDPDQPPVAHHQTESRDAFLLFRIGPHGYAVPATSVLEVLPYLPPVPVPGVPSVVAGVVNVSGRILALLDLSVLLGAGRSEGGATSRCVLLESDGLPVAIAPDEIFGLAEVKRSELQAATDADSVTTETFVEGGRHITVLAPDRLLAEAETRVAQGGRAWSS